MTVALQAYAQRGHRCRHCGSAMLALLTVLLSVTTVRADPVAVINTLRSERGCSRAVVNPVRREPALDRAAEALAGRDGLEAALERVAYSAASSLSLHVEGAQADDALQEILARRFCKTINDPLFQEVGVYRNGIDTWIVLARRQAAPPTLESAAVAAQVLALVNAARERSRRCGRKSFEATQALKLSPLLNAAALGHARDMAERGSIGHDGSDGSSPGERIARAGYRWRASGENVAAGQRDADAVVAAWLESPGHCANLMSPRFAEMGVAFALAQGKDPAIYWAQVFATP